MTAWRFEQPLWLWAMLLLIPAAAIGLRFFGVMSPARRLSAVALRAGLIALIALVLAGAANVRTSDRMAVIAVVDVSDSIRRFAQDPAGGQRGALERMQAFLREASAARRSGEELFGIVAFDGRAALIATPSAAGVDRSIDVQFADGTNIGAAIDLGLAALPPDAAARLVLISDGNETAGDALEAASRAAAMARRGVGGRRGVPIDVVPVEYNVTNEVYVESVDAPPRAAARATINVRVVLVATDESRGRLSLLQEGRALTIPGHGGSMSVTLSGGRNVFVIPVELEAGRVHRFEAVFEPEDEGSDTLADNNRASTFTISPGKGSVLIVDEVAAGPPGPLETALREGGIDAIVVAPEGFPESLVDLQGYDLVVLRNVPAEALSARAQQHLVAHVRDLGGGLMMLGGPMSFGAGGWRGTPVEPLLPVKLDLPDRLIVPEVAIVFVLDNSGSMARFVAGSSRTQQEIVNESAAMAVKMLDPRDLVGVITFNNRFETLVRLGPNTDPERTAARVRGISPGGGTNIGPALSEAMRQLGPVEAKVKHAIVLTDGISMGAAALPALAAAAREQGIQVSTIGVGDDAEMRTLQRMADAGGGKSYQVINPSLLPRVFLRAVRVARSPLVRETPFTPVVTASGSPLTLGLEPPPQLLGLTLTEARPEPSIFNAMVTPEGEPVLAHWNYELGQVAAFTSDADTWAAPWLDWPGYRQFWTQAVRTLSRLPASDAMLAEAEVADDELRLRLEAGDDAGRPLDFLGVPVTVYPPDGDPFEVQLAQTGPGRYEGRAPARAPGSYIAVYKPRRGDERLAPVLAGASVNTGVEFRQLSSNREFLERIAGLTGGRVHSLESGARADLFNRQGVAPQESLLPLRRALLIATLAVLLMDIATRRIAWDRFFGSRFNPEYGAAERGRRLGAAQTLEALRSGRPRREAPELALSEADARRLAAAEADRRRMQRLRASARDEAGKPVGEGEAEALLAAKLRARKRFDEENQ